MTYNCSVPACFCHGLCLNSTYCIAPFGNMWRRSLYGLKLLDSATVTATFQSALFLCCTFNVFLSFVMIKDCEKIGVKETWKRMSKCCKIATSNSSCLLFKRRYMHQIRALFDSKQQQIYHFISSFFRGCISLFGDTDICHQTGLYRIEYETFVSL